MIKRNWKHEQEKKIQSKKFYMNFHVDYGLGMEFTACKGELMPERWHHSPYLAHIAALRLIPQTRSNIELLIPSVNIMVLVWHFSSRKYIITFAGLTRLNTFIDLFDCGSCFGPPCVFMTADAEHKHLQLKLLRAASQTRSLYCPLKCQNQLWVSWSHAVATRALTPRTRV